MKNSILLAVTLGLTLGLGACSDDDIAKGGSSAKVGDYIEFGTGIRDTRTYYGADDNTGANWILNWNFGTDKVRIFSKQADGTNTDAAQGHYADYTVKEYNNNTSGNQGQLQHNEDGLKWTEGIKYGEYKTLHHFYGVYPATDEITCVKYDTQNDWGTEQAVFKFPFYTDQKVTVESTTGTNTFTDANDNNTTYKAYKATANTSELQYMIAAEDGDCYTAQKDENDNNYSKMHLDFTPIMTAVDVVVMNPSASTVTATVMSVVVQAEIPTKIADEGCFYYKKHSDGGHTESTGLCDKDGAMYSSWSAADKSTTQISFTATISGGAKSSIDNTDLDVVDLAPGECVTLTVFLPPVDYSGLKFFVNGMNTGGITAKIASTIKASQKVKTAAKVDYVNQNNDWITPLDDSIYVQQLSIPGTNEAISYLASGNNVKQGKTIIEQLNMGVRAFDIQIDHGTGSAFNLYAGGSLGSKKITGYDGKSYDAGFNGLCVNILKPWLDAHPGEFVILTVKTNDSWSGDFKTRLQNSLGEDPKIDGSGYLVKWKKDLTVGKARKHVVVITRNVESTYTDGNIGNFAARMEEGYKATNVNNSSLKSTKIYSGTNSNRTSEATLYYFASNSGTGNNYTTDENTRFGYITNVLDAAKANADGFPWSICYVAGSQGRDATGGYLTNAQKMHPKFYKWLNTQTIAGPLGIVHMDFVGYRTYKNGTTTYNTQSDLLPAAIINNNYRFTLKKAK